jgi:hypothetical protein
MVNVSKVNKFYVYNNMNKTVAALSKDTGLSEKTIKELKIQRKKLDREQEKRDAQREVEESTKSTTEIKKKRIDDYMGKKKGAVVMTEAASQMSDESKKRNARGVYDHDGVTKIRPE